MSEDNTNKNPLDEMDDDAQSENGDANHSDAQSNGDAAAQGNSNGDAAAPPAAPTVPPAAPTASNESAAPTENDAAPVPPQQVAPRMSVGSNDRDFGITYGRRKSEIAKILQAQPKVAFMIPPTEGEPAEMAYEVVQINGHRMEIKKGVMVTIPQQVAQILANKYRVQMEAGADKRIDRSEEVTDHLTR